MSDVREAAERILASPSASYVKWPDVRAIAEEAEPITVEWLESIGWQVEDGYVWPAALETMADEIQDRWRPNT
jgi:hypothetical protein